MIETRVLAGDELVAALDSVAALRISVFRDWPYLYDGSLDYERDYLRTYIDSLNAVLVGAFDGDRLVGASTGTPMRDHSDDFSAAFAEYDTDLDDIFYCAESVLLAEYRGQGLGHRFFDLREAHARDLGFSKVAFCAVQRSTDHPLCPQGYCPLDAFWRGRGYRPLPDVIAHFAWKDVDQTDSNQKPLMFWIKSLSA